MYKHYRASDKGRMGIFMQEYDSKCLKICQHFFAPITNVNEGGQIHLALAHWKWHTLQVEKLSTALALVHISIICTSYHVENMLLKGGVNKSPEKVFEKCLCYKYS
jgi:hypothetical protein